MHVRDIHLQKFMSHDQAELKLPERGIVLVTGPNGVGKSALLIESIAAACFGRTLRGTPPWRDEEGTARVEAAEVVVQRSRAHKKPATLVWNLPGERARRYDTPTKSQDALCGLIGDFNLWRRTSVFSSADASHFSLATDKERKLLLEGLLGLDRFDEALKRCREDVRDAKTKVQTFESQAAVAQEKLNGIEARLADLAETEEAETKVAVLPMAPDRLERMQKLEKELSARFEALQRRHTAITRETAETEAEVKQAEQRAKHLDRDNCPTCAQPIPESLRKKLRQGVTAGKDRAEQARARAEAQHAEIDGEREGLAEELQDVHVVLARARAAERDQQQLAQNRKQRADKQQLLEHQRGETEGKLQQAKERAMLMRYDLDELEIVAQVLGLKGVRAHLLGDALRSITELTNAWLGRLFPDVTIFLHEEADKVALDVRGLAHEHGYAGASSGQRRRLDIAILLALGDLEAATRGKSPGTLFLDEVADSLDEEGIALFSDVLNDLAKERAVVLISHNPKLYEGLTPVMRVVVEDGRIRTV